MNIDAGKHIWCTLLKTFRVRTSIYFLSVSEMLDSSSISTLFDRSIWKQCRDFLPIFPVKNARLVWLTQSTLNAQQISSKGSMIKYGIANSYLAVSCYGLTVFECTFTIQSCTRFINCTMSIFYLYTSFEQWDSVNNSNGWVYVTSGK